MAYTPELSLESSRTLRRIAWGLGVPMTQAIERVFEYMPKLLDPGKVCDACRDKSKCSECLFSTNHNNRR